MLSCAWQAPVVSSVGFSPPQAGDAVFAAAFNERVNHRDIAFADDLLNLVRDEGKGGSLAGANCVQAR